MKEGDPSEEIYIIMKGEFDIYTKRSLLDIDNIISTINKLKSKKFEESEEKEKIESIFNSNRFPSI